MINMLDDLRRIHSKPKLSEKSRGKRTRYSNKVVHKALEMCRQNKNFGAVSEALGMSRNTVRNWVETYSLDDVSTLYKEIRIYQPAFIARRKKITKLVTKNPLGRCEISKILKVTSSTIGNDILALINTGDVVNVSKIGNIRVVVAV